MPRALWRFSESVARAALGASGTVIAGACGTLWVVKATSPPDETSNYHGTQLSEWWRRRTSAAGVLPSAAAAEDAIIKAIAVLGVSHNDLSAAAKARWNGVELCVERSAVTTHLEGDHLQLRRVVDWCRGCGALDRTPRVAVPETRATYATDVGSSAPAYLGRPASAARLSVAEQTGALSNLRADGIAIVSGCVDEVEIQQLRRRFRIVTGSGPYACPSEVATTEILAAAQGASSPLRPSEGRRHFLLRGTEVAEQQGIPLLAPLMPLIYEFFAEHRRDVLPGALLAGNFDESSSLLSNASHLFLSECQLLVSDPGAVPQIWHRDNRQPGLTLILPITDIDDEVGPTQLLPGTHHLAEGRRSGPSGAVAALRSSAGAVSAAPLRPGSALIYDSRILHRGLGNSSYGRCRVVLVMRVDYTDTPPPGATIIQTAQARFAGNFLEVVGRLYASMPVPRN